MVRLWLHDEIPQDCIALSHYYDIVLQTGVSFVTKFVIWENVRGEGDVVGEWEREIRVLGSIVHPCLSGEGMCSGWCSVGMAVAGSAQKAAEADGRAQGRQLIDLQHCASYREVDLRPPVVVRQGHNKLRNTKLQDVSNTAVGVFLCWTNKHITKELLFLTKSLIRLMTRLTLWNNN
jgi:hypothetical protein